MLQLACTHTCRIMRNVTESYTIMQHHLRLPALLLCTFVSCLHTLQELDEGKQELRSQLAKQKGKREQAEAALDVLKTTHAKTA